MYLRDDADQHASRLLQSPTPSDAPDQEHRQEDQGGESPGIVEEEGPVEDLDNEIEDRDNTREEEQDDTMGD
jgi:hypothetical protein